jgi:hypothetical protein
MFARSQKQNSKTSYIALGVLICGLGLQVFLNNSLPHAVGKAAELPPPPSPTTLKLISFGEPHLAAQLMLLYLQASDTQPGTNLRYLDLDYQRVGSWLGTILAMDSVSQYPLLIASHLYAQVPNENKQRMMLDFIYREFLIDPNRRWPALAHASVIAKHRLKDLPLALKYANAIANNTTAKEVPSWAKQMPIFILEDMGELEAAKVLIGGLLESGKITDTHEINFLVKRLEALEHAEKSATPTRK